MSRNGRLSKAERKQEAREEEERREECRRWEVEAHLAWRSRQVDDLNEAHSMGDIDE